MLAQLFNCYIADTMLTSGDKNKIAHIVYNIYRKSFISRRN